MTKYHRSARAAARCGSLRFKGFAGFDFSGRLTETQNGECISPAAEVRFPVRHRPLSTQIKLRISYLWPACVTRAMISRRLSVTVVFANSSRSAGLIFPSVALMAAAHLSMPSALG